MLRSTRRALAAATLGAGGVVCLFAFGSAGPRHRDRSTPLWALETEAAPVDGAPDTPRAAAEPDRAGLLVEEPRADPANAAILEALAAARAREAVPELLLLLDTDIPRRDRVVRTIAAIGGDEAWQGLIARLGDPTIRTAVELALGRSAPPEVIDRLKREFLASKEPAARASGARILANTADPRHGAEVRELLLREREWEVRHASIGALGRFGDATTLAGLARHGGREGSAAGFALMEVRDARALEEAATRWPELDGRTRFALLHAATGSGGAFLDVAKEALHDPDERVRLQSVRVLAGLGDDAVEPLLDHALRGASRNETERVLAALAGVATPKAAEAGLRALEALPPRRQERYRAVFLATLGR